MHRFCKDCIEAWLRTQIENNCPQCRVKFSSKRDCKPDPNFDLLLGAMFGNIPEFEQRMLDPSVEVLEAARAVGHQIVLAKEQAAIRRQSPPPLQPHPPPRQQPCQEEGCERGAQQQTVQPQQPGPHAAPPLLWQQEAGDATVAVTVVRGRGHPGGSKRGHPGASNEGKRLKMSMGEDEDGAALQYRGVRFQGDNWQARTKRLGKELSLGLYNTAEEAGMAYDLDRLQQQGGKAQRLNFPLLRQHYKQILTDLADLATPDGLLDFLAVAVQAGVKASRGVPGATAPENTGPAAASIMNPRRSIAPAVHVGHMQLAFGAGGSMDAAAYAGGDSDYDFEDGGEVTPAVAAIPALNAAVAAAAEPAEPAVGVKLFEQHALAAQRAEQLAADRSLEAGMAGGVVHVRLEAGGSLAWRMSYVACPVSATVDELAEAVALGLCQQHFVQAGGLSVGLAVANDLDASADFDALCCEDSATGTLLLRSHLTIRKVLHALEDPSHDLAFVYYVDTSLGGAAILPATAPTRVPASVVAAA